ncbi:MAG: hypothetical protein JNN27_23025 [Planctomycetes bacterium]|nr:hypothetical protein [Planctomycetota bacterium]
MNLRSWSLLAAACALGARAPQTPPSDAQSAPSPSAYSGSVRDARARLRELAESAQHEQAAAFAESVLAAPTWSVAAEREQAEFWFAVGVARGAAQAYPQAADAAHAARGLSGSSELGLSSGYNAGAFRLVHAERLRQDIPQIRERLKLPPLAPSAQGIPQPGGAPQGPVGQETASDPIAVARGAYLAARADLIERWRAGPDADTCANLELIVRRLRELDELERQNEEQQNESSERENKDQKKDPQQQDKQDPSQQQDQQQNEEQKDEQDPKEQQDKPEDSEQDAKDEQKQNEESKPESEQDKQEQQGEQQPPKDGADPAQEQEQRVLTPEEVQRLLQQLDKIEDQAAQVQAALRRAKRVPVKKDW